MNAIKATKLAMSFAVFACVALSGYFVSQIIWTAVTTDQEIVVPAVAPEQVSSGTSVSMQALQVAQANLFGRYQAPQAPRATPVPTPPPPPPKTPLTFELKGVLAGLEGSGSASIARARGQRGELFRVGDSVFGQATLKGVYGDRVVFDRNGSEETLSLHDDQLIGDGTGLTQVSTRSQGMASVSVGQAPVYRVNEAGTGTTTTFTNRGSSTDRSTSRNAVSSNRGPSADSMPPGAPRDTDEARNMASSIIEGAQQDPERILARYGLRIVDNGYMVTGNARLLMAASLRPGDVVVAVDGVPVGDPAIDARRLQSVISKTSLQVEVLRDGQAIRLNYRLPALF